MKKQIVVVMCIMTVPFLFFQNCSTRPVKISSSQSPAVQVTNTQFSEKLQKNMMKLEVLNKQRNDLAEQLVNLDASAKESVRHKIKQAIFSKDAEINDLQDLIQADREKEQERVPAGDPNDSYIHESDAPLFKKKR